jgi:hypothetical protein
MAITRNIVPIPIPFVLEHLYDVQHQKHFLYNRDGVSHFWVIITHRGVFIQTIAYDYIGTTIIHPIGVPDGGSVRWWPIHNMVYPCFAGIDRLLFFLPGKHGITDHGQASYFIGIFFATEINKH